MKIPGKIYFVYILQCRDNSLYAGITTDIARRLKEHIAGIGSRYTRSHGVRKIMYQEQFPTRSLALKREAAIKKMPRGKKLDMIILKPH